VGLGVSELIGRRFMVEAGPRLGLGAAFCNIRDVHCEGVISVQPGVAAGDLGVYFDLSGVLDVRVLVASVFELSATGALSFIGGAVFAGANGNVGIAF
jgi:hypothetical protein